MEKSSCCLHGSSPPKLSITFLVITNFNCPIKVTITKGLRSTKGNDCCLSYFPERKFIGVIVIE